MSTDILKSLQEKVTTKKQGVFTFYNEKIQPGESVSLAMPLPEIFGYAPYYMPVKIFHGKKTGPVLLVFSTIHGDELNGIEIVNRFIRYSSVKKLKGTLIVVPVVNVYGLLNQSSSLPDGQELEFSFPGSTTGTYSARLAKLFVTELLEKVDCAIQLTTGKLNRNNLPHINANLKNESNEFLANLFGVPLINQIQFEKGSLHTWATTQNLPFISYEAGEAMRLDENSVKNGVRGIVRVMQYLKMLNLNLKENIITPSISKKTKVMYSPKSGMATIKIALGEQINRGEVLAIIKDPFGAFEDEVMKSPIEGIVVDINTQPLVYEGQSLFKIGIFDEIDDVVENIQEFQSGEDKISESNERGEE